MSNFIGIRIESSKKIVAIDQMQIHSVCLTVLAGNWNKYEISYGCSPFGRLLTLTGKNERRLMEEWSNSGLWTKRRNKYLFVWAMVHHWDFIGARLLFKLWHVTIRSTIGVNTWAWTNTNCGMKNIDVSFHMRRWSTETHMKRWSVSPWTFIVTTSLTIWSHQNL